MRRRHQGAELMTLDEVEAAIRQNKDAIWHDAVDLGRSPKIYLHWTAGDYDTDYDDYHFSIHGDGAVRQTHGFDSAIAATYMRNTGSVSIAMDCAADAAAYAGGGCRLGPYPPTDIQIECMAQLVNVITKALDIPIDIRHVMTHAEAADNLDGLYPCDPYGPSHGCERWDLAVLKEGDTWMSGGDTLRGKAIYYREA